MGIKNYYIIDFDSTFVKKEGLEVLAEVVLVKHRKKTLILDQINKITAAGMEGKITFNQSLNTRLKLLRANRQHVQKAAQILGNQITNSINRNQKFFLEHKKQIYIVSGGFKDFVAPVVKKFGIPKNHILANDFVFDKNDWITGVDKNNPLSQTAGKAKAVARLRLHPGGVIWAVGDGYTDYEIKQKGVADYFVAFTENVRRENVVKKADWEVNDFNHLLSKLKKLKNFKF